MDSDKTFDSMVDPREFSARDGFLKMRRRKGFTP